MLSQIGKVESYLRDSIKRYGSIHLSLIDPENFRDSDSLSEVVRKCEQAGTSGFMVGGSTVFDQKIVDDVVMMIKKMSSLPVILFPNDITGLSRHADAVWFMSLLNSMNPYFITGIQMKAAFTIKSMNLEPIPMAYIILGEGKTAGYMGYAHNVPLDEPKIAAAYALAAEFMGFRFVYLESGSGASTSIREDIVKIVDNVLSRSYLIIGGGIRSFEEAYSLAKAGGDIIVTGNILEENIDNVYKIIEGVKKGGKDRIGKSKVQEQT